MGYLPTDSPDLLFQTNSSGLIVAIVSTKGKTPLGSGSRTIAGNGNVLTTDVNIRANATSGAQTLTLPAVGLGQQQTFKKVDSSANFVTISGNGILIDGQASVDIENQFDAVSIWYDATSNTYNLA
jgi:hypothetical protein